MPIKVMTLVGTRPEIIKLSRVIYELDHNTNHILVHSGQNYDFELNQIFFQQLNIRKPDYFLNAAGETAAQTIGNVITKIDDLFIKEKPDAFLILGDTNSCLAVIAAKRHKIPIFHMEAGNRCFDLRVPEEINRKIVDHISDINMVHTEHARRYLLAEGIRPETIIKTGSPVKEVLLHYMPQVIQSKILEELILHPSEYFVVSAHREENIDNKENIDDLLKFLNAIADKYGKVVIFSTHPRTRKRFEGLNVLDENEKIKFLKPLGFFDYIYLQMNAFCVISDSGTITEESSILNFPAVTIRNAHERPEGMDEGTLIMCGLKADRVIESIEIVTAQHSSDTRRFKIVGDYDVDNVSKKVLRIILSYTDYIDRTVWQK
ncbi:MAG: UDP-N-acetylglucosamine 2-epimerase (non-hydrolyzing) [Candidatus Vogelbacteria bacterium]|nr:UDP-N-acetylglucosamine 2-epimerase (non-hydrolyzing) [Candidatus Vogelbacteria bacterium]